MNRIFFHSFFISYYLYIVWFVWSGGLHPLTMRTSTPTYMSGLFTLWMCCMYFLPSFIGAHRGAAHSTRISMINVFLGWTGIGWIVALLMALFYRRYYI